MLIYQYTNNLSNFSFETKSQLFKYKFLRKLENENVKSEKSKVDSKMPEVINRQAK